MARFSVPSGGWWCAALAGICLIAVVTSGGEAQIAPRGDRTDVPLTMPDASAQAEWSSTAVDEAAKSLPRLHSLLLSRRGELIFEGYYGGARRERPANTKSAA